MAVHLSLIDFAPDGSGTIITTTSSLQPRPRVTQVADVLAAESQPGPRGKGPKTHVSSPRRELRLLGRKRANGRARTSSSVPPFLTISARHGLGGYREVVRAHRASGPALDEHDPVETAQEALEQLEALLRSRS